MKASITLSADLAAGELRAAAKRAMYNGGPISHNEKRWSRWALAVEEFGDHEVTIDLDELHLMRTGGV